MTARTGQSSVVMKTKSESLIPSVDGLSLSLANDRSLAIRGTDLLIRDPTFRKQRRSLCSFTTEHKPGHRLIPLYNVLWVELSGTRLVVDYAAEASKASVKCASWTGEIYAQVEHESTEAESFVRTLISRAYGAAQLQRRSLVLINPSSGPGWAPRLWREEVKPLFEAARMAIDTVTLKRGGEALQLAERVDIDKYDMIAACSGDGTPHEIFNGLARRGDARKALSRVAVSLIPCGSGNAMACNLYGTHKPSLAALAIIKGIVTPLDLISVTQGDRRFVSFLSQSLGIVAESDLATEHLRWMGSARFDLGVFTRVFRRKCYPCDLAVQVEVSDNNGKDGLRAHYKRRRAGDVNLNETIADQDEEDSGQGKGLPSLRYGTIQDELPNGWELVSHDNIGTLYCGNMAYMAPCINFFPAALASDGCMDLVTIKGDLWPLTALRTLMSAETGKLFDRPQASYQKVSAYRLIPRGQTDGYISIDGERAPFEPFQAEVHQGLGRVISRRGRFETDGPSNWDAVSVTESSKASD